MTMLALGRLLELTLAGREPSEKIQLTAAGVRLHWLAEGALEVMPTAATDCGLDLRECGVLHHKSTDEALYGDQRDRAKVCQRRL